MAGRKGQSGSGGHNKKSSEDHERDGTRSHVEESAIAPGALSDVYIRGGGDVESELRRLEQAKTKAYDLWTASLELGEPDRELRMCWQAAFDRHNRLACELAREVPKDDAQPPQGNGPAMSMSELLRMRDGNGAT